jgi:hypothetical protein
MPANEQTWRDIPLLHRIFAITGVLMLLSTIWVFWADHRREWRRTQDQMVRIDTTMNRWRQEQFETDAATLVHTEKSHAKLQIDAESVPSELIERFAEEVRQYNAAMQAIEQPANLRFDLDSALALQQRQVERAVAAIKFWEKVEETRQAADEAERTYADLRVAAATDTDPNLVAAREAAQAARREAKLAEQNAIKESNEAARLRTQLVSRLDAVVINLRNRENIALNERKFRSADLDAARANVDIAVRDNLPRQALDARVREIEADLRRLNENYQIKNESRIALQRITTEAISRQTNAAREYEEALAGLDSLKQQYAEREQNYVNFSPAFPWVWPGKRILNLPVLNAFNSPQRIENLWSEGLTQNYNFREVRRFDRCTTCHQMMQRTLPGAPLDPAYIHESDVAFLLLPPERILPDDLDDTSATEKLEQTFGLRLAGEGLVNFDDVTVSLVLPESPAARAQREERGYFAEPLEAEELRESVAQFTSLGDEQEAYRVLPGLLVGDSLVTIDGAKVTFSRQRVAELMLDAARSGRPVRLTVRRGLANPFTTHPRLDLFVGDASPHPMGTFGCTICHDGQGSATSFKWASHTPDDPDEDHEQYKRWAREHGWFDNHHWIYPMYPKRFAEAACLKCHHDVTELEVSERFPEPPAPKVTHGYHLIRKYGCYGCHEVNGFDGPDRRVGPDLRTEPNYFAAALQLGHLLPDRLTDLEQAHERAKLRFEEMHAAAPAPDSPEGAAASQAAAEMEAELDRLAAHVSAVRQALELTPEVAAHNYDKASRDDLYRLFAIDAALTNPAQRAFTEEQHRTAAVLRDVESPGSLRKPGPTLRYVRSKLDPVFTFDWTANPRNFRPDTRMPRFFGLWNHLDEEPESKHLAQDLEPIEIHGIVQFLNAYSQSFVPAEKPQGISESSLEAKRERGRIAFETRGCLACHSHQEFPKADSYRGQHEIVQGPNLTGLYDKFHPERNPAGRDWLYSWIKDPTQYNVRTLMPNLYLDPIESADEEGNVTVTDPVDDIVEFLLDPAHAELADEQRAEAHQESASDEPGAGNPVAPPHRSPAWRPIVEAQRPVNPDALRALVIEYLAESFPQHRLEQYYENGIPARLRGEIKLAEQDLVVDEGGKLTDAQRLAYVGRKSISKYGCYGCHDIPGFEDAKPIGTGLADWGRKDPSRLAFEHITHYLEHGHGHATSYPHAPHEQAHDVSAAAGPRRTQHDAHAAQTPRDNIEPHLGDPEIPKQGNEMPPFYERALTSGHRSGFIYQKLREPRSYDYMKTSLKKYNDRLRMPEFPFNNEEREAVITFVLGLVAEPPTEKYVYRGDDRAQAIAAGKRVLEEFNCGGCHVLEGETWNLSFQPELFEGQSRLTLPPFVGRKFDPLELERSAATDRRGRMHATIHGLPALSAADALPAVTDAEEDDLEEGQRYAPVNVRFGFDLYEAVALAGQPYQRGLQPLSAPGHTIESKFPAQGGFLARYLAPRALELEREENPRAQGNEVYGWLPPPLMGEGSKVRTDWLYDFLREPYAIRPAVFLRMPKFNLSPDDTTKLVNYFAARDNAQYPYELDRRRQSDHLARRQSEYQRRMEEQFGPQRGDREQPVSADQDPLDTSNRLQAAMNIITRTECKDCHAIGDYIPTGRARGHGPDLAQVYQRLRPEYTRQWIANPKMFLPYTPMPVNIFKYDPEAEHLGGLDQRLYHGTSIEQLDAVVDLLMNYDVYAKRNTNIARMVPPPMEEAEDPAEAAEPPAEASVAPPPGDLRAVRGSTSGGGAAGQ